MSNWRLSPLAEADLQAIWNQIGLARHSPDAADRQIDALHQAIELLATSPLLGESRSDLRQNLRSFVAGSYSILYYPVGTRIDVARILHAARDVDAIGRAGEI